MAELYSLQVERHALSAFLKHSQIFAEVDHIMSEFDFVNETNRTIFTVIRSLLSKGEKIDKVLLAQKIENLGYKPKDELNIFKYLDALSSSQITSKAGIDSCKELIRFRVRREISETADKIKEYIAQNGDLNIDALVAATDKIYNERIFSYQIEHEPVDLYAGIEDLIMKTGANPVSDTGLITPYNEFNRLFGGIRAGNGLYAVVSRPKHGKSTWLLNMAEGITMLNKDTIALYLDTEMQTEISQFRAASAITDAPMWYLETGNWSRNPELTKKVKATIKNANNLKGRVYHMNVANRPIEQICSLIRRFFYKHVGRNTGKKLVVIYDYIKLTGETLTNNWAEHQAIGEKINMLNETGNELKVPIWAAMQLNRSAEDGRDDSAAIAVSDRLQWFAAFVAIFRRKRLEEIALDGIDFGSHKMIPTATRFQGKDSAGHHDMIKVSVGKEKPRYETNFINYNIENFRIGERGTLVDIVNRRQELYEIKADKELDDDSNL